MAEPASTTAALGWAVASGIGAAFLAGIGVTWPVVFWATVGGVIGATFAPQVGRMRSMIMFPAAALLAAKGGTLAAVHLYSGDAGWAGGFAGLGGVIFHPAITALVQKIPALLERRV